MPAIPGDAAMEEARAGAEQRVYARIAGVLYLVNYGLVMIGLIVPSRIRGSADFAETARRILGSEHLYRGALASLAVRWVTIVLLAFALFVTLEPVNRRLAQLALLMRLGEAFIGAVVVMWSVASTQLRVHGAQATSPFQVDELQGLVAVTAAAGGAGFQVAMAFFAVGSALFFFLFYESRWLPRALGAFGIFASATMLIVSLLTLTFPARAGTLQYGWAPMLVAEVTTALWLVIRGVSRRQQVGRP
jgi:hypothetical protein